MEFHYTFEYLREFITKYINCVENIKKEDGLVNRIFNINGVFAIIVSIIAIIFLLFSRKTKKFCITAIVSYVSFTLIKSYKKSAEIENSIKIFEDTIRKVMPGSVNNFFGNETIFIYILISLFIATLFVFLYAWVKYIFVVYCIYVLYKRYEEMFLNGTTPKSNLVLLILILGISIIVLYVVFLIEDILIGFVTGFIGSSIVFGFCKGFFDFPEKYYTFYENFFKDQNYKDTMIQPEFAYVALLCIVCMIMQRSVFGKK